ncbi:MAG TPA: hypothetical protein VNO70_25725 [Blastocatellia bacterium]|nr:hypothetical protein [Blastocatellia bacterium]
MGARMRMPIEGQSIRQESAPPKRERDQGRGDTMMSRNPFSLIAALAVLVCGLGQLQAQGQSLGITPAFVDAKVKRGATYQKAYTIANRTDQRLRLRLSVGDCWYNERIDGPAGTLPRSASSWVQFTPAAVIIDPGASATVKAIISVPQTAAGGYYTAPIFEAEPSQPASRQEGAASVAVRVQGLLMLTTEDNAEYNVEVKGGAVAPSAGASELELKLDVYNRSTTHATVRGLFTILDRVGGIVGRGRIEGKRYMPGQRDALKACWAGELAPGRYRATVTLSYDRVGMEPAALTYEMPFEVK